MLSFCRPFTRSLCSLRRPYTNRFSSTNSTIMAQTSPFTETVVASMRYLYPEVLADKSFDNTGLLLEAPLLPHQPQRSNSVLLTIDLTRAVADEAITNGHTVVVAYHPIIFRGLKSVTLADTQQNTLLRLASHGISVYSPHTAVDIVPGGMADWLCDIVSGQVAPGPEKQAYTAEGSLAPSSKPDPSTSSDTDVTTSEEEVSRSPFEVSTPDTSVRTGSTSDPFPVNIQQQEPKGRPRNLHRTYSKPSYPSHRSSSPLRVTDKTTFHPSLTSHDRTVITPSPSSAIGAANALRDMSDDPQQLYTSTNTGAGRVVTFSSPQPLSALITRIANAVGQPKGFPVAIPQDSDIENIYVKTVGVCPGSGSSVIRNANSPPDLIFTGEMSHHEALAIIERGGCVISLFHSNSERGYLESIMREQLESELRKRWASLQEQAASAGSDSNASQNPAEFEDVKVVVSQIDRDPFGIVVLQESQVEGEVIG